MTKAYKKNFLLFCSALSLAVCLGGCGGGGGGGNAGSGGGVPGRPAYSLADAIGPGPARGLKTPAEANGDKWDDNDPYYNIGATNVFNDNSALMLLVDSSFHIAVSGDSLVVSVGGNPHWIFNFDDFTVLDNGLVSLQGIPYGNGDYATMMLGGKPVELDYSNFGLWVRTPTKGYPYGSPILLESKEAVRTKPTSAGAFKGKVMAIAYDNNAKYQTDLLGEAALILSAADKGDLSFSFPNFYTLTTALNIEQNGGFSAKNKAFSVSDGNKNTTGIKLVDGEAQLGGHFYSGNAASPPTEAVGAFQYTAGSQGVKGSFGVKETP